MTEIRDVLARAMRAQGKADPDEVFAKADELNGEPADRPGEPEHPQLPLMDELALNDDLTVLGTCVHGVDLDHAFCPEGCRV